MITTASARNHDYVRGLGADRVIDYQAEDFTTTVPDCDVVFDTVGGDVQVRSYAVLKPGGRLVWIAAGAGRVQPSRKDVETLRPAVARDRAHLERMLALLEPGAVRRRRSPVTSSPMRPRRTRSARGATCRASWSSRSADPAPS